MDQQQLPDGRWVEAEPIKFHYGFIGRILEFFEALFACRR